ncbi:hypothetical protein BKA62DRAFT_677699 [Auriculariales sp. MPI-PUGE-AT-0066]|nr:hypothetical protein BKA62DRAFT_677699 [Auriculariales sp. MPI-PUGE-AT-0066]
MSASTYDGPEKLVFAIDLGTTMSAVAFAHFVSGQKTRFRLVTRWPGQQDYAGDCKVPSVVRYDSIGHAMSFGAEALEGQAEYVGTSQVAKWYKLHLHPESMKSANNLSHPPLPTGVSLKTVYTDMLGYLFTHSRTYLDSTSLDTGGHGSIWQRLKTNFELCLTIPNGWNESQQQFLRAAIVAAGIFPTNHAPERLKFVSEAEAAVHFAIEHNNVWSWLCVGKKLVICDAGEVTVDSTVYKCTSTLPLRFEVVTASECVQAGSAFLDLEAERALKKRLEGSRYGTPEIVDVMVREFKRKTKRRFDGGKDSIIQFGLPSDTDRSYGIKMGRLNLTSAEIKAIFDSPITTVDGSIDNLLARAGHCDAFLLVGGFAENAYFSESLKQRLSSRGIEPININEPTKKVAAEGAIVWCAKQHVVTQAVQTTYGIEVSRPFDSGRYGRSRSYVAVDGQLMVSGLFSPLVVKASLTHVMRAFVRTYAEKPTTLADFEIELMSTDCIADGAYSRNCKGQLKRGLQLACTLRADLSGVIPHMRQHRAASKSRSGALIFRSRLSSVRPACAPPWSGMSKEFAKVIVPNSVV